MGYFDLPTGELELNLKPKKDGKRNGWTSVMFTDGLYTQTLVGCVEEWSRLYKVLGARYNGREVTIPKKYHWELCNHGESLGSFKTRAEAVEKMHELQKKRRTDKSVKVGIPKFFLD